MMYSTVCLRSGSMLLLLLLLLYLGTLLCSALLLLSLSLSLLLVTQSWPLWVWRLSQLTPVPPIPSSLLPDPDPHHSQSAAKAASNQRASKQASSAKSKVPKAFINWVVTSST